MAADPVTAANSVDAEVTIPAGALAAATTITIDEFSATDPALPTPPAGSLPTVLQFGPAGQTFAQDVTLKLFYLDANNDGLEDTTGVNELSLQVNLLVSGAYVTVPNCTSTNPPVPDPCVSARNTTANTIDVLTRQFSIFLLAPPTGFTDLEIDELSLESVSLKAGAVLEEKQKLKIKSKEEDEGLTVLAQDDALVKINAVIDGTTGVAPGCSGRWSLDLSEELPDQFDTTDVSPADGIPDTLVFKLNGVPVTPTVVGDIIRGPLGTAAPASTAVLTMEFKLLGVAPNDEVTLKPLFLYSCPVEGDFLYLFDMVVIPIFGADPDLSDNIANEVARVKVKIE